MFLVNLNECLVECLEAMENKSSTNNMNKEEEKSRISHGQVD